MRRDAHLLKVEVRVSKLGMLTKHLLLIGILVGVGRRYAEFLDGHNPRVEMTAHGCLPQNILPDVWSVKQVEGVGGEEQLRGILHGAQIRLKEERPHIMVQFLVYSVKHDEGGSLDPLEQPRCHAEETQLALCLVILRNA